MATILTPGPESDCFRSLRAALQMLHEFHQAAGARFGAVREGEAVADYGNMPAEHDALWKTAGVLDLSSRGRLCLTGTDRLRFLHGQVTNDVNALQVGQGCYAALVTAKGRMVSDLNIYRLENELLLDFEPGLVERVTQRLEHYIIADDVQVVPVLAEYGLLSVQGPRAEMVMAGMEIGEIPARPLTVRAVRDATLGEICVVNQPRLGTNGFDVFAPAASMDALARKVLVAATKIGGRLSGWEAFELARIEAGLPRFGVDMDESNLVPETGIEARAISYSKGCYIGQEVIARIRTYGQVTKTLRGLRFASALSALPERGAKLYQDDKEVGHVTSAVESLRYHAKIGLGYVRHEANATGTELRLATGDEGARVRVVDLPFAENFA
jgi:folate-binding protein YgfZ